MDDYVSLQDAADYVEPGDSLNLCIRCGCDPCSSPELCDAIFNADVEVLIDEFSTHAEVCANYHLYCASPEECEDFDYRYLVQCWRCRLWVKIEEAQDVLQSEHVGWLAPPPCGTRGVDCNEFSPSFDHQCRLAFAHAGAHDWAGN